MSKTITIIDTFGFFFRSFYALPQYLKTKDGFPTGLLTGFSNFIASLQKDHDSDYILFAIDSKGENLRNGIYEEYKANRQSPPDELTMQLPIAIEWIEKMGYKAIGLEGYEADDIIASVVTWAKKEGLNVRIVSHDKDLHQLIDDGKVVLVDAITKKVMDEELCFAKYGVTPKQFIDYQSIVGDSADNVPGVKGIGKVGAAKLLSEYESLDGIYENIEQIKPASMQTKLKEHKDEAYISKELVSLKTDLFGEFDFEEFKMDIDEPFLNIYDELVKYEQNAILRQLSAKKEFIANRQKDIFCSKTITDKDELITLLSSLKEDTLIAFDTETTGLDYMSDTLVGFSFCFDDKTSYYVPLSHNYLGVGEQLGLDDAKEVLKEIFKHSIVGHNIKFDLHFITKFLDQDVEIFADTLIMAWMLDNDSLSLDKLSYKFFNYTMLPYEDVVKKGETFANVDIEDATKYASEDAFITLKLYHKLLPELKDSTLDKEYFSVEVPFIKTLLSMEREGIKVDTSFLKTFGDGVKDDIAKLTKQIHTLASSEFNINSPKQLGLILFEELALPAKKKTKTGYSTDENVLNALKGSHEIIEPLLEYRELQKLNSTYIEPLIALASANELSRVHTSFSQSGTSTGRLSSKNPNLQNIPTRTPLGLKIREAFIADESKLLIGIDYSQIELRLLAHFSQDSVLVNAFNDDKDIHLQTAIMLFGEGDAKGKRDIAKTVNFGLLYGMGQNRLAQTLGISTKEAKEIIERYFSAFSTVDSCFKSIIEDSKLKGFTQTLLGRKRYFNYEKATPMLKASYEREAVNSVFQGSASDIIKLAMNKIDKMIKEQNLPVKMLLQIHDELIFEADEQRASEIGELFKKTMEDIIKLHIPLKASLNIGKNWSELK